MIDMLVIRLGVEYFLFANRQIRELMLPRHSLTALIMHGAAVHAMYCLIITGAMLLLLCGGRILRGGLSMTKVYIKCTALFIVRCRTPARCK